MRAVNHRVFAVVSLCLGLCTGALAQSVPEAPAIAAPLTRPALVAQDTVNAAHTGWMMTSTALVLLMTLPGIALFYAGMVRRKNVLNTMASVVAIAGLVSLLWFVAGYSLAFTPGSAWLGGWDRAGFAGLDFQLEAGKLAVSHIAPLIPESVYAMFQLTFAIITAALLVGAFVERMRFSAMLVFIGLWTLVVYAPTVGGVAGSLLTQAIGVGAVAVYSLVVTAALLWVINFAMGLRVDEQSEQTGLDIAQHRERLGG
eukprot:gene77-80_t